DEPTVPEQWVELVQKLIDLLVAAVEHGGVVVFERSEPGIGRAAAVPHEGVTRVESLPERARQLRVRRFAVSTDVDPLDVVEQRMPFLAAHEQREDRLLARPRERELGEAPSRLAALRAADEHDARSAFELGVELLLPVPARRNAVVGIEVEKQRLKAGGAHVLDDPPNGVVGGAAVADEDRRHAAQAPGANRS